MSQYIIDTLGWFLMIGAFLFIMVMICACITMAAPLWMAVLFDREQRHGRMLEFMDKQIELEKAMRCGGVSTNPLVEVEANPSPASPASPDQLTALCEREVPDVPATPT